MKRKAMAEITAALVKELRDRTSAGMMDCKKALAETDGDIDKAAEYLQIKGIAKAAKKEGRVAAEGIVAFAIAQDAQKGALVEVNCETDFVARNEAFQAFVQEIAEHVLSTGVTEIDALLASSFAGGTLDDARKARIASIGENITVRRAAVLSTSGDGLVGGYSHGGGTIGVLAVLASSGPIAADGAAAEIAKGVCLHIAASNPQFLDVSQIPDEARETEKRVLVEQAMESGKPAEVAEKMVVGRLRKWEQEICLVAQEFIRAENKETVADYVKAGGKELGVTLSVSAFERFERGAGIEKAQSNLADEVAALTR
jgi:elongation factor Ts